MKRPRQGIRSTQRTPSPTSVASPIHDAPTIPIIPPPPAEWIPLPNDFELPPGVRPNMILDDDESLANVFCYGAFADKRSGVVYNDLTGSFPFVSYNGSVCFLVMYHYEANAIMTTPISG